VDISREKLPASNPMAFCSSLGYSADAVSTNTVRLYGRGPRGEWVLDEGTWKTITSSPHFGMTR
jgi:hypothetical protein